MRLKVKRVYEEAEEGDGRRILVDRVWPRGMRKEEAKIAAWVKEAAPSNELRKWFGHDPAKWKEFRRRYFRELDANTEGVKRLKEELAGARMATLVFGAKEERFNNAVALKEYLEQKR